MNYLEAPTYLNEEQYLPHSMFLAGSITNAWDWQRETAPFLTPHFQVYNPRRESFDIEDKAAEQIQIKWEYMHLMRASHILFWFSHETLAPITLFELATTFTQGFQKDVYIGIDPYYKRKNDVLIQLELRAPKLLKRTFTDLSGMVQVILKEKDVH